MTTDQNRLQVKSYAERLDSAIKARHQAFEGYFGGPLFSLTSLMGPISDGPAWPSDAAWLACEYEAMACIVTDGLSDPWVEPDRLDNGLGLEVFIATPELKIDPSNPMAIADTWLFPMIAEISHTLASYPRLCSRLINSEPVSLRCNIDHLKDGKGLRSVLLYPAEHQIAHWNTQMVVATILTPVEAQWLVGKSENGRQSLTGAIQQNGVRGASLLRESLV